MIELVDAGDLRPGDVIHDGSMPWTVKDVRSLEQGVVSVTATCGTMAERFFATRSASCFHVERWESRVRAVKQDLVMRIMG